MRAFIFSLDAFVAFMVALMAIYSLIFFSSVPSAYYSLLTQAHYLSRDSLLALSTTFCDDKVYPECNAPQASILDNIASDRLDDAKKKALITATIGNMVPDQFGYAVEVSGSEGEGWNELYTTMGASGDTHAAASKKLSVSTQVITFGYSAQVNKPLASVFNYLTCGGDTGGIGEGSQWGVITCGEWSGAGTEGKPFGNINPKDYMGGGDLVPQPAVKIVRLTVFI